MALLLLDTSLFCVSLSSPLPLSLYTGMPPLLLHTTHFKMNGGKGGLSPFLLHCVVLTLVCFALAREEEGQECTFQISIATSPPHARIRGSYCCSRSSPVPTTTCVCCMQPFCPILPFQPHVFLPFQPCQTSKASLSDFSCFFGSRLKGAQPRTPTVRTHIQFLFPSSPPE